MGIVAKLERPPGTIILSGYNVLATQKGKGVRVVNSFAQQEQVSQQS